MLVRDSSKLSTLRERIPIPSGLDGRWAAARRNAHAVAGFEPSPIELVIWIPIGSPIDDDDDGEHAWSELGALIGAEGPPATIALQVDAARAVAADRMGGMCVEGFDVRVTGPRYPAHVFEGGGFGDGRAVRIRGGLLVGLTSA